MSIIEIFINHNLEKYIDDEIFINKIYFLSKNKNFIKRRKSILRFLSLLNGAVSYE